MNKSMKNIILVIGLTPQGLSVLRTLSRAGYKVFAFYNNKKQVGRYSKYGTKIFYQSISELKEHITCILKTIDYRPICYITSGEMLASILRDYKEIYQICNVLSGPYETISKLAHKDLMYKIAIDKGLKVAEYCTLDNLQSFKCSYPLFLKRNFEIPLFFKTAIIHSPEELNYYLLRIKESEKKDILLQNFINIPRENLLEISAQTFFSESHLKGILITNQKRRLKKGITSFLEEINDPTITQDITRLCNAFMADLNYTGFAEFEFMYNTNSNQLYFIEVNTRTCGLQSSMNHKFSNLLDVMTNPYNSPVLTIKKTQLYWMNIQRDIRARIESRDFSHLLDIFKSSYDILDWKDIKPFFRQFL